MKDLLDPIYDRQADDRSNLRETKDITENLNKRLTELEGILHGQGGKNKAFDNMNDRILKMEALVTSFDTGIKSQFENVNFRCTNLENLSNQMRTMIK